MDVFVEQIIKKKYDFMDSLIVFGTLLLSFVLVALCLMFFPFALILVIIGDIALAYYIISSRNIEFEYSITNGDITIDKIINKSRRKRIISIDAHDIEFIGKDKPTNIKNNYIRLNVSQSQNNESNWYFSGHNSQKGNVFVLFTPNDKVLSAIKPFLSRQVAIDAFGRN
jgi:lipopolysaccharide export LptBFGC system permease protein LptF